MQYWLMKTEPESFSIDDLAAAKGGTTAWDGVRNYQARNMMRDQMRPGDEVLVYHSSCAVPGVAGIAAVVREGYPDATAFDRKHHHYDPESDPQHPRWYVVDLKFKRRLARVIPLDELRAHAAKELKSMVLLRPGNRLSVMPVDPRHFRFILALE
jgi:predicted RNA-binding protein with PUA-like domain